GSLFHQIHDATIANGRMANQMYTNIVDAQILTRSGEGMHYEIKFRYERFYDYHAGRRIFQLAREASSRLAYYRELITDCQCAPFLWGGIQAAVFRELNDDGYGTVIALARSGHPDVWEVLTPVLVRYGTVHRREIRILLN